MSDITTTPETGPLPELPVDTVDRTVEGVFIFPDEILISGLSNNEFNRLPRNKIVVWIDLSVALGIHGNKSPLADHWRRQLSIIYGSIYDELGQPRDNTRP